MFSDFISFQLDFSRKIFENSLNKRKLLNHNVFVYYSRDWLKILIYLGKTENSGKINSRRKEVILHCAFFFQILKSSIKTLAKLQKFFERKFRKIFRILNYI